MYKTQVKAGFEILQCSFKQGTPNSHSFKVVSKPEQDLNLFIVIKVRLGKKVRSQQSLEQNSNILYSFSPMLPEDF